MGETAARGMGETAGGMGETAARGMGETAGGMGETAARGHPTGCIRNLWEMVLS